MLTEKELTKLRSQIVLNSLFMSDYENDIGVNPENVQNFFDSYIEFMRENAKEQGIEDDHLDEISDYDTPESIYDYYRFNYDDDPLPKDEVYQYMRKCLIPFSEERYKYILKNKNEFLENE